MSRRRYEIRINEAVFKSIQRLLDLDFKIETEFPLFETSLVEVKPLEPPAGKILHMRYRYDQK